MFFYRVVNPHSGQASRSARNRTSTTNWLPCHATADTLIPGRSSTRFSNVVARTVASYSSLGGPQQLPNVDVAAVRTSHPAPRVSQPPHPQRIPPLLPPHRPTLMPGEPEFFESRVAVVGAGGLGSPVLTYLAAAGVGHLHVIDADVVELSNLNRQTLHGWREVGRPKAQNAAAALERLDPTIAVEASRTRLDGSSVQTLLSGADAIVDATDNYLTRDLISRWCRRTGTTLVWGAVRGAEGYLSTFRLGEGITFIDAFPDPRASQGSAAPTATGVIGAVCGVIGSMMAMEVLKCLSGLGEPMTSTVMYVDLSTGTMRRLTPDLARSVRLARAIP